MANRPSVEHVAGVLHSVASELQDAVQVTPSLIAATVHCDKLMPCSAAWSVQPECQAVTSALIRPQISKPS